MPKKDYYNDPDAPAANSIVVAVTAIVRNDAGELLMIERSDNGLWALPGGAQEIGEPVRTPFGVKCVKRPAFGSR